MLFASASCSSYGGTIYYFTSPEYVTCDTHANNSGIITSTFCRILFALFSPSHTDLKKSHAYLSELDFDVLVVHQYFVLASLPLQRHLISSES